MTFLESTSRSNFVLLFRMVPAVAGSEELFILDPLPTRSTTEASSDSTFLSRPDNPTPSIAISHAERNADRDQDHDEDSRLSGAGEEVGYLTLDFLTF